MLRFEPAAAPAARGALLPQAQGAAPGRERTSPGPRMRPRRSVVDRVKPRASRPRRGRSSGCGCSGCWWLRCSRSCSSGCGTCRSSTPGLLQDGGPEPGPPGGGPRAAWPHPRPDGHNIMVGDQVTQDITLSRVAAQQHPEVVGQLAALLGITDEPDRVRPRQRSVQPVQTGPHHRRTPRCPTSSTSASTPRCSPASPPWPTPTDLSRRARPACQMLGYVGQINGAELQAHSRRGTSWATCSDRAGSRPSTRRPCGARRASTRWR